MYKIKVYVRHGYFVGHHLVPVFTSEIGLI